jgi:hypothetical protein
MSSESMPLVYANTEKWTVVVEECFNAPNTYYPDRELFRWDLSLEFESRTAATNVAKKLQELLTAMYQSAGSSGVVYQAHAHRMQ